MKIIKHGELEKDSECGDEVVCEPDGDDTGGDHEEEHILWFEK